MRQAFSSKVALVQHHITEIQIRQFLKLRLDLFLLLSLPNCRVNVAASSHPPVKLRASPAYTVAGPLRRRCPLTVGISIYLPWKKESLRGCHCV